MAPVRIYRIDAFTTVRGEGNPAGVVTDARGLSDAQMQAIARELGHSETAFVLPPRGDDHDIHVRFFSPTVEVPVCGHATVGAHFALALEGGTPGTRRQLTGAGVQAVETRQDAGGIVVRIRQNAPEFDTPLRDERVRELTDALGLAHDELDPRGPVQFVSTGHGKLMVPIRSRERLYALRPDMARLAALDERIGTRGYFVFTLDAEPGDDARTHGRMFAPGIGIEEDPVTGNANGPMGAWLVKHGLLAAHDGEVRFRARQRNGAGRGGFMDVAVSVRDGEPVAVAIEGRAVLGDRVER
ncbi:PhzF family phenazine biosynthesis isomerase [Lysobacter arvi]|uniref:PhzF family phenazine biosynthesis isomerase n=1 Tax=Lysobacter arvi TaxID=3038776 RepID=A0ABU1CEX7_9GAMM|nr:PhzF family phenazine biosynthesis isomerase [Lysobacter arvi]MDR0183505.1 PhzF family phenazine biosynthesis isomerase [Lysobacter arvi]